MKEEDKQMLDDEELILMLCMPGDEADEALRQIHKKYGGNLFGYLKGWGALPEDCHDLIHAVYFRIWSKAQNDNLNIDSNLKGLLVKIAHDTWVDFVRKRSRENERISSDNYIIMCEEAARESKSGLKAMDRAEFVLNEFLGWLHTLPTKQQQIAYVWADCHSDAMDRKQSFAKRIGPKVVYNEMLKRGIDPGSVGAVKGAMQQFIEKFRSHIGDIDGCLVEE